jgi:hypothetical protein
MNPGSFYFSKLIPPGQLVNAGIINKGSNEANKKKNFSENVSPGDAVAAG